MQIGRAVHGADALLFGRAFAGPQVGYRFKSQQPHTSDSVGEGNCAMNGTGSDFQGIHGADALLFGRAFAGPQLVYRFKSQQTHTFGADGEGNYAINGKNQDFPASSDPLSFAKSSVTTLLTRVSLRFILPDNRLVVENPIANAR